MIGASRLKSAHRWLVSSVAGMVAFWQGPSRRGSDCSQGCALMARLVTQARRKGGIGATDVLMGLGDGTLGSGCVSPSKAWSSNNMNT